MPPAVKRRLVTLAAAAADWRCACRREPVRQGGPITAMWQRLTLIVTLSVSAIVGCRTLHTDNREDTAPVAIWFELAGRSEDGRIVTPPPEELVVEALKRAGIAATVDERGLHLAPRDEERAREALLTDPRLADSGVLVLVPVPAGTGRKTSNGIEFTFESPTTAPFESPTTAPSK
jgi:hypothetical protein